MSEHQDSRSPFLFFVLTIAYSWILWLPSILTGLGLEFSLDAETYTGITVALGAFAPLAAALTLIVRRHGWKQAWHFIRHGFDFRTRPVFFLLALALPLVLHAVAHYLAPLFGLQVADNLLSMVIPEGASPYLVGALYFYSCSSSGVGRKNSVGAATHSDPCRNAWASYLPAC